MGRDQIPEGPLARGNKNVSGMHATVQDRMRTKLLEAGVDALTDSLRIPAVEGWMDVVRATRVAQLVGKTTGAFFHWWRDQEAFRSQVLDEILSRLELTRHENARQVTEALPEERTAEVLLAAIGELALGVNLEGADFDMTTLLLAVRESDERITPSLRGQYNTVSEATAGLYKEFLVTTGRQMRPTFTKEHFATTVIALANGLGNRAAVEGPAPTDVGTELSSSRYGDLVGVEPDANYYDKIFGQTVTALAYGMSIPLEQVQQMSAE